MDVCSPKDSFIVKLLVIDGSTVNPGTPLVEMDSDWEERIAERIRVREVLREINFAQLAGDQLELVRSSAKAAVDLAETQYKLASDTADFQRKMIPLGILNAIDVLPSQSRLARATFDRDRAHANQKQLEYAIDRHTKTHELAKKFNEYSAAYMKKRIERLKVAAPIAGHVKLHVQVGSFAQLGSTLLEIQ